MAIRLRVPEPELFSFAEAMKYTTRGFDDPRYVVGEQFISTAIARRPPDRITVIRVSDEPETLAVEVLRDGAASRILPPGLRPRFHGLIERPSSSLSHSM